MREQIPDTILVEPASDPAYDHFFVTSEGHFADTTLASDIDVEVGWDGQIRYAVCGEKPERIWWFAGSGEVRERR